MVAKVVLVGRIRRGTYVCTYVCAWMRVCATACIHVNVCTMHGEAQDTRVRTDLHVYAHVLDTADSRAACAHVRTVPVPVPMAMALPMLFPRCPLPHTAMATHVSRVAQKAQLQIPCTDGDHQVRRGRAGWAVDGLLVLKRACDACA